MLKKLLSHHIDNEKQSYLISIRKNYCDLIFGGSKRFELRNKFLIRSQNSRFFVYETQPLKKIIGYFDSIRIVFDDKFTLWDEFGSDFGLDKGQYFEYSKYEKINIIEISNFKKFDQPIDPYKFVDNFHPPQNYFLIN